MHTTEILEFFRSTFPYQDRKVILSSVGPLVPCLSIICFLNTGVVGGGRGRGGGPGAWGGFGSIFVLEETVPVGGGVVRGLNIK